MANLMPQVNRTQQRSVWASNHPDLGLDLSSITSWLGDLWANDLPSLNFSFSIWKDGDHQNASEGYMK